MLINFFGLKGIGLGYKIGDESFSLVHQLYKNNKIDHLSFALEDKERNGTIHFGGIPNDAHLKMPYKGYINIDEDLPLGEDILRALAIKEIQLRLIYLLF